MGLIVLHKESRGAAWREILERQLCSFDQTGSQGLGQASVPKSAYLGLSTLRRTTYWRLRNSGQGESNQTMMMDLHNACFCYATWPHISATDIAIATSFNSADTVQDVELSASLLRPNATVGT